MFNDAGKFCPLCKFKNDARATVCAHCGIPLDAGALGPVTTRRVAGGTIDLTPQIKRTLDQVINNGPENGIAIYITNYEVPSATRFEDEFVLGRETEDVRENIVDLTPFDAYSMGVSRRHAKIRRTDNGYEIIDLESTNGTWANEKRLIPNVSYPLENGTQLRLGRIRMFVVYGKRTK
jgi:hypothetical protein